MTASSEQVVDRAAWDDAFAMFVERDWAQIRARAPAVLEADWPALAACVMAEEREELRLLCLRTLVLELNCARMLGQLRGATPEARFAEFCARFHDAAGWSRLFEEYAVLGATVDIVRRQFRAQVGELLERLARDRADLAALGVEPGARLVGAVASLSDPHRGGRCVWRLAFAGGGHVMYKPKALAIDARFQRLLGRCNAAIEHGALAVPLFRLMRVADRGAYGWVEYLAPGPCADDAAVARFYRRQGATLALLHALLGTDVHYENLIAHGEHPIVVDLETLFHPFVAAHEAEPAARGAAEALLERSVLRVGLLPWRALQHGGKAGINVGGLGDGAAQALPFLVPRWEGAGRDDMRLVERQIALPVADNLPRVGGRVAPFFAHADAIAGGFEAMARHISRERDAWTAPGGVLDAFADDPVRYILRPTRTYTKVLQATAHPDHLRTPASAVAVRAVLDELRDVAATCAGVRAAERADLEARDVPYFGGRPGSTDVWDSRGGRLTGFFAAAPLEVARARVAALDDAEVARQLWYTRAALAAAAFGHDAPGCAAPASRADDPRRGIADRAVALAAELGERLAARAVAGRDGVTWIGLVDCATDAFTVAPLGAELYDGTAGIALFLATLGRATGEDRFLALADRAARAVRAGLGAAPPTRAGGFVGAPSQLYALAHVGALLGDAPGALDEILDHATTYMTLGQDADVIYGAAGALLALLAVQRATGREALLPHLLACLDTIERAAVAQDAGVAWPSAAAPRPLLGFSHGAAGIACALARLGELLAAAGHPAAARCAALVDGALRYERARFDAQRRNWPDFRAPDAGRNLVAWCHGAPGVVLARLAVPRDAAALAELDLGVSTTLAADRGTAHSLCHGTVGNLAIVAHAAERLDRADWRGGVAARLPALLSALAAGPLLDSAFADAAPGLMTGLAGVGYGLLALARPAHTPCVLALDAPGRAA